MLVAGQSLDLLAFWEMSQGWGGGGVPCGAGREVEVRDLLQVSSLLLLGSEWLTHSVLISLSHNELDNH